MLQPQTQIGPYTLTTKIGEGNFGVVWLGERRTSIVTTRFALKFPKDADLKIEAIKQEAEVWMQASGHPNVLPIIEAESYDGQVVIVSEYVTDGSLKTWLEQHKGKSPSIEAAVEMMLGILAGLEHLHERGIIHRDLKPDNILLQRETPRLADFGIARLLKTVQSGVIAGTPAYMAPEVFDGQRTAQTDIWAAGAIFYQLLSGHLAFPQQDMASLFKALIALEPDPLSDSIPRSLKEIIARSLRKNPQERFQSATEMRQALRAASRYSLTQATVLTVPFAGEPNLGPLVAKMCNRRQQENEFSDFFIANLKQLPGCPQVFLIRGEEKECHDSLIERLVSTRIKQVAEKKWGAQQSAIVFKTPDWAYDGTLIERQLELKRTLFSEFDPAYMEDDLSAKALSRLPPLALSPLVVLRYRIHASRWDQLTAATLNWFLSYWAGLVLRSAGPQFLIFFSIIYPRAQALSWWKSLMSAKGFDKQNLEAELQSIATAIKAQLPLLILKELTPIQPHEVHDWFSRYNIYDEKKRHELSERIFETQDGRKATHLSMADIEHALFQIHQTYVRERGYL
ncbi:MAG: eukaryotic-like serine/threonine-protein kinase [Acidobacteriota bacterium]|jgi:serine/threonine protein kinase|nr:eukaryotic-like serine/threonine-protein kinase [Acidobacteriota bacterium]